MVNALTQRHRAQQLLLRKATKAQVATLFARLSWDDLDGTYPDLAVPTAQLVQQNRAVSAGLATTYVRTLRTSQGVPGDFTLTPVVALNVEQFGATLHSVSVAALKQSAANGIAPDVAMGNALSLTKGAMARLVLSAGRETVLASVAADPRATGWERVLGGAGCPFCQELAGRVYSSENAGFEAHGNCACSAEPVFE